MGTKRARFGSIRKLRSGRFQARYVGPDGVRHTAPSTFPDEDSAREWLDKTGKLIDLGAWNPPAKEEPKPQPVATPTVGEFVMLWLTQCKQQVATGDMRITSLQTYENIMENRVLNHPGLCSTPVDKITPRDVARWWGTITTRHPDTPDRNKRAYSKLRTSLALAVEYGFIDRNPVEIQAAKKRPPTKHKNLATTQELSSILEHMPERYKLVTALCLFHGLRVGEALAVKHRNVETLPGGGLGIRVEGTLARASINGRTQMKWQPPKTQAGHRLVPVLEEFSPLVRNYAARFPGEPNDYLTRTDTGAVVMDTSYRSIFNQARDKAGAPSEITPHYGRNWLITRLAEAGATPKEIGAILGQEDVSTIVNVYMRVRQQRPVELMRKINPDD